LPLDLLAGQARVGRHCDLVAEWTTAWNCVRWIIKLERRHARRPAEPLERVPGDQLVDLP
jgi:hypothetical protein